MNLTSGEGGLISFPLLLLERNAIFPMTSKAGCAGDVHVSHVIAYMKFTAQILSGHNMSTDDSLPNIKAKRASKLLEHGPPPLPQLYVQKRVKIGENKITSKLLDSG